MIQDFIICHYGEIALKGKNRNYFESQLIHNIKLQLDAFAPKSFEYVKKISGGILIKLNQTGIAHIEKVENALRHTFGIVNYTVAASVDPNIETLKDACWKLLDGKTFDSFRITTVRSNKQFLLTSHETNQQIGEYIYEKLEGKIKVDLKNPGIECHVIITNDLALVSLEKKRGLSGMPMGTAGKAMVLMSGGFDSPVAAWQVMRRGVSTRFVHFHSIPYTSRDSVEKVHNLISVLKSYQSSGILYLVPFADVQKEIMMHCPAPLRVVLYRRFMMRITEALAKREKALALVTGDSIGQVASQTLENIFAVSQAATMPIFRPLIGMDKEDIMHIARNIGTYDISKLPHDDCCTRLMPKNPETRAQLAAVLEAEKNLDVDRLIQETLEKTEKKML